MEVNLVYIRISFFLTVKIYKTEFCTGKNYLNLLPNIITAMKERVPVQGYSYIKKVEWVLFTKESSLSTCKALKVTNVPCKDHASMVSIQKTSMKIVY